MESKDKYCFLLAIACSCSKLIGYIFVQINPLVYFQFYQLVHATFLIQKCFSEKKRHVAQFLMG